LITGKKNIFGSSPHGLQIEKKDKTMRTIPDSVLKELAALSGKSDEDIDYSDIPDASNQNWSGMVRGRFYRPVKQQLTVRIDADVLEWLKNDGEKGYQKRLNAILREAMLERRTSPRPSP